MKKISVILLIGIIIIFACEKDDFCIDNPVTPSLILRFYDEINTQTLKPATSLYVWAEGKDSIFVNQSTDSLVIPLNSLSNQTIYNLSKNNVVNQFTINYETEEQYVSRSCGFKVIFNNVTFSSDNNWFVDFTPTNLTTIDNQNSAHVQVYH